MCVGNNIVFLCEERTPKASIQYIFGFNRHIQHTTTIFIQCVYAFIYGCSAVQSVNNGL